MSLFKDLVSLTVSEDGVPGVDISWYGIPTFSKYVLGEWPCIESTLDTNIQLLSLHTLLLKIKEEPLESATFLKSQSMTGLEHVIKMTGVFAKDILGDTYEHCIKTARSLNLEHDNSFWLSCVLTDSYKEQPTQITFSS